ncbi:MAG: preprotein translocase subunit YajC [Actinomycetes bacterium]
MSALFPFAIILLAFYLLIIRPARTRQRATNQLQDRLAPGLEVMTTSGMFGRVSSVQDDAVALEVAPGVTLRFSKAAVGRIVTDDTPAADVADDEANAPRTEDDDRSGDDSPSR